MDFYNRFVTQYPEIVIADRLQSARDFRAGGNGLTLRAISATARLLRRLSAAIEQWASSPAKSHPSFHTRIQAR